MTLLWQDFVYLFDQFKDLSEVKVGKMLCSDGA